MSAMEAGFFFVLLFGMALLNLANHWREHEACKPQRMNRQNWRNN